MAFKPTEQQKLAIFEKGNILVSAAAGSGKTAVLVERVISMLTDKNSGINADELLIVTFTNAAANEMRSRIEKRLDEECLKNPNDTGLLMQKHLLSNAKICTIDSFCIDLVRENFEKLDISPDFKIVDEYVLQEINQNVIYSIINRYLEENNPVFADLLDIIGAEYDENNFANTVLKIYRYSRQLPFPQEWFNSLSDFYQNGNFTKENIWYKKAFQNATVICKSMRQYIANIIDLLSCSKEATELNLPILTDTAKQINILLETCKTNDWDLFYNALKEFKPLSLSFKGVVKNSDINAANEAYKYVCNDCTESLGKMFYENSQFIDLQFKKLYKPIKLLSEILIELNEKLFIEYKNSNQFTFHNTEHLALKLLCKKENGEITVNPDSLELLNRYKEVMVDEYQDTNDMQDMLFNVLSNFEKKLFAVGDVKQSIYGFRGANPSNFLNKKNRYIDIAKAKENEPKKIILGNNFRCKPEVCDFINFMFNLFMQNQTGEIIYSDGEQLIATAKYPKVDTPTVCYEIIDCANTKEKSIILEARHIANIIKETVNSGECIKVDDNTLRKAKYSDFTILFRALTNAPIFVNELKKQGIPINLNMETYADSIEVSTVLSLLKVIDNPQRDIELLSLMLSVIFNFSPDEMAEIRANKPNGNLYSAVIFAAENGNQKCKAFLETLKVYRRYAVTLTLPELISKLLIVTEILNIASAMKEGIRRKNNLLLLCNYAEQYSQNKNCSLSSFVKYITEQSKNNKIKSAVGEIDGDSVKIMTIHASKGLQFPICIVANTTSRFNDQDAREGSIYNTDLGLGFRYFDEDDKKKYNTISRQMILLKDSDSALQEELRLLYVALTRTQDRLILVSSFSKLQNAVEKYKNLLLASNCEIDYNLFSRTKSYADWLMLTALLHPCGKILRGDGTSIIPKADNSVFDINIIDGADLLPSVSIEKTEEIAVDYDIVNQIQENMEYRYPFSEILKVESKTSVSAVANKAESEKFAFENKPLFLSDGGITPSGRGTAMHKVMQFFDFTKSKNIDEEIERLYEWQYISEAEMKSLNKKAIMNFFESDVFARIKKSPLVKREMRFLTEVPATKIDNTLESRFNNENVIIQGAVDVCFIEDDEVVILDFKTDRVDDITELKEAYSEQLSIYALACEKIFGKKVKEKLIYSFKFSDIIKI